MTHRICDRVSTVVRRAPVFAFLAVVSAVLACFCIPAAAQTIVDIRPAPDPDNGYIVPWDGSDASGGPSSRLQTLYLSAQIGVAGTLSELWWYPNGSFTGTLPLLPTTAADTYTNVVVRVGHTTLTQLTTTFDNNVNVGSWTIFNVGNYAIPAGVAVGTPIQISIPATFIYDTAFNLVVEVSTTSGLVALDNVWELSDAAGTYTARTLANATDAAAATGNTSNWLPSVRLVIGGGGPPPPPGGGTSDHVGGGGKKGSGGTCFVSASERANRWPDFCLAIALVFATALCLIAGVRRVSYLERQSSASSPKSQSSAAALL